MNETLITNKEALEAFFNNEKIQYKTNVTQTWFELGSNNTLGLFERKDVKFRRKVKKQYNIFDTLFEEEELPVRNVKYQNRYWFYSINFGFTSIVNEDNLDENILYFNTREAATKWYDAFWQYDFENFLIQK